MAVWQVERPASRYLRGGPGLRRLSSSSRASRAEARHPVTALGWLLGGYALIGFLVAWMLAKGHPDSGAILALGPIAMLVAVLTGIAAMAAVVFAARRYMIVALGVLGIAVGVGVTAVGAMVTALL
jgi:hypothetical protein